MHSDVALGRSRIHTYTRQRKQQVTFNDYMHKQGQSTFPAPNMGRLYTNTG